MMETKLRPWLEDELPPELRRLLLAARSQEPGPAAVQRVMVSLGVVGASTLLTGQAAAVGSARVAGVLGAKWLLLGGGLVGALAVGVAVLGSRASDAPSRTPGVSAVTSSPSRAPASVPQEPAAVPSSSAAVQEQKPQAGPWRRGRPRRKEKPAIADTPAPVEISGQAQGDVPVAQPSARAMPTAQTRDAGVTVSAPAVMPQSVYVDRARRALVEGDPRGALRILDDYDQAFHQRTFVPEALRFRMLAHEHLGDRASAERVARILVDRYGATPEGRDAALFLGH
jgi:hypothetical protein